MDRVEQIADALLYEGYVLYPYRASAPKNRFRWQMGMVMPRAYAEETGSDPWFMQTECLAEMHARATLAVRARCLHIQERVIETAAEDATTWHAVPSLLVDNRRLITWDEAAVCEFVADELPLDGRRQERCHSWVLGEVREVEAVHDRAGRLAARIVRRRRPVVSAIRIQIEPCGQMVKIRVRVENWTPCSASTLAERDATVRQSLAGTHTVLAVENSAFVSLLDPPRSAAALASACVNIHTFPVLVGPVGSRAMMLSSPIILYDHPAVAPESPGNSCDGTEIDEMLMLRVKTLTENEKLEARATDDRAADIIDRGAAAAAETMARLHGAVRHYGDAVAAEDWEAYLNPPDAAPHDASCSALGGVRISRGSRVRLEPAHRADSIDMCLRGRSATVTAVYRTLEDTPYVAVTLDDDPFGASGARYRRLLYFHPDEIVSLDGDARDAG